MTLNADLNTDINTTDETLNRKRFEIVVKHILKDYIKQKYNKPGNVYLGLVHRLDRPVGGIMVFAKTSKAASRLSEQVRTNSFNKIYYAVIEGNPS